MAGISAVGHKIFGRERTAHVRERDVLPYRLLRQNRRHKKLHGGDLENGPDKMILRDCVASVGWRRVGAQAHRPNPLVSRRQLHSRPWGVRFVAIAGSARQQQAG
jgi:hypothetical protein